MLHTKQFTILKEPIDVPEFEHLLLNNGWILSYHQLLPVSHDVERQVVLLGYAWQVLPGKGTPQEIIRGMKGSASDAGFLERLIEEEESWCGRYVLIAGSSVLLDTAGTRGVLYSSAGLSSDVQLLAEVMGRPLKTYQPVEHMTWCPGPMTAYDDIFRLLPSQIYDFEKGELRPRQLLAQNHQPIGDWDARIEKLTEYFCCSMRNMAALFQGNKLLVAVSGGYDSRTSLSVAVRSGIPIEGFTLDREDISVGDRYVPGVLCRKLNLPYTRFPVKKERFDKQREQEFIQHVGGTYYAKERNYYCLKQYDDLADTFGNAVLIRGGIWEVIDNKYSRFLDEDTVHVNDVIHYYCLRNYPREVKALEQYFRWCAQSPQKGLSSRVRFDWEQSNAGCWIAEIEHAFDLYPRLTSVQPLNCRLLMTMLLESSEEDRRAHRLQTGITEYACSALIGMPYGSDKPINEISALTLLHRLQRVAQRMKTKGIAGTIILYRRILQDKHQAKQNH